MRVCVRAFVRAGELAGERAGELTNTRAAVRACMRACVRMCARGCVCAYVCARMYVCVRLRVYVGVCVCMCARLRVCVCTRVCVANPSNHPPADPHLTTAALENFKPAEEISNKEEKEMAKLERPGAHLQSAPVGSGDGGALAYLEPLRLSEYAPAFDKAGADTLDLLDVMTVEELMVDFKMTRIHANKLKKAVDKVSDRMWGWYEHLTTPAHPHPHTHVCRKRWRALAYKSESGVSPRRHEEVSTGV